MLEWVLSENVWLTGRRRKVKEGWRVGESKKFVIPFLPPSMNSIYNVLFGLRRIELKPEVRLFKTKAKVYIPLLSPNSESHLFKLDMVFYYDFFFKNGKLRKVDSQNLMKVLIDAVAEKNGIGDEYFKFGSYESYHDAGSNKVECTLSSVIQETP